MYGTSLLGTNIYHLIELFLHEKWKSRGTPPVSWEKFINNVALPITDPAAELKDKAAGGGSEDEFVDNSQGFRSICASPDGLHLAAGDRSGNLRIFDLETMKLISFQVIYMASP